MSNMLQPEGPPSMPRHTTRLVPKPSLPRRCASMRETDEWLKGSRLRRKIRILAEVDDAMLSFGGVA